MFGPSDGGAGQIINPWPLVNAAAEAAVVALLVAAAAWLLWRLLGGR